MKGEKVIGAKSPRPRVPIIIPNAELLSPEELKKAKHAEKMRRYMARKRAEAKPDADIADPGAVKKTGQEIRKIDTKELVELSKDTRNLAIQTLSKKLMEIYEDPVAMSKINLATLATTFGILFDKTQLMNGLSTENISIQAKIDVNMTSDKAIEELNRIREGFQDENN